MDYRIRMVEEQLQRYKAIVAEGETLRADRGTLPDALRTAQARRQGVAEDIEDTLAEQKVSVDRQDQGLTANHSVHRLSASAS